VEILEFDQFCRNSCPVPVGGESQAGSGPFGTLAEEADVE